MVNVSNEIVNIWEKKLKDKNLKVENYSQLSIERTSYNTVSNQAYIPGSSIKGALATALLNSFYNKNDKFTEDSLPKFYLGEFDNSILRGVKFSDLIAEKGANTKILFSVNFYKELKEQKKFRNDLSTRKEFVAPGQYRAFSGELSLWDNLKDKQGNIIKLKSINQYLAFLNDFNRKIFFQEMNLLVSNNLIQRNYVEELQYLINQPNIALIRLGKAGAESKSIREPGVAKIKINKKKRENSYISDHSTTLWLSSDSKDKPSNLYPLGWAILEIEPENDNIALSKWCESLPKLKIDNRKSYLDKELKEKEILAKKEKEAALKYLSPNQREIMDFIERFDSNNEKRKYTESNLYQEVKKIINNAMADWGYEDRRFISNNINFEYLSKKIDFFNDKSKKEIKKLLAQLEQ